MTRYLLQPDYAIPPGETILETLEALGMTQAELAKRLDRPLKTVNEIIQGKAAITPETALQLERVLGIEAVFWITLESQYQSQLRRAQEVEVLKKAHSWVRQFPYKEMADHGWLSDYDSVSEKAEALLRFFAVASVDAWQRIWMSPAAAFRRSSIFESSPFTVAAWLRRGEIVAGGLVSSPFDSAAFRGTLGEIRGLTAEPPEVFQRTVTELCAKCGVSVAFVPELPKCPVSGATRWIGDKALMQLSLRYRTDDQLWFSFFHEAGHILRHGKKQVFLERAGAGLSAEVVDLEQEANRFAEDFLIPKPRLKAFLSQRQISSQSVRQFASDLGVSPGIVVGRLQHDGIIPYHALNSLKRTLRWSSAK